MSKKQIGGAAANKKITSKHTEKIVEMRNFLSGHKGQLFQCFLALLIFLCGTYRLKEVGQPILFNDEFGYWSASSFFLGSIGRRLQAILHIILMVMVFCWHWCGVSAICLCWIGGCCMRPR